MAGWNGAGVYDLRYTFVNDAAASIKILASRQDQMWNDLKAGIQNCMTLDGQTTPTQNINLGGKKITNLAAATLASDAVRFDQITTTEWVADTHGFTWVSATSFKILAVDVTSTYHAGRRIKFLDNGNQRYATVVSSSFSTDTTLVLAVDGGTALVGPTTSVNYGLVSFVSPSYLSPISAVDIQSGGAVFTGTGDTKIHFNSTLVDALTEFDSAVNFRYTPRYPGYYAVNVGLNLIFGVAAVARLKIQKNGADIGAGATYVSTGALSGVRLTQSDVVSIAQGDFLEAVLSFSSSNAGNGYGSGSLFGGFRLR